MQTKEIIKSNSQAKYEITISSVELNVTKQQETKKIAETVNIQGFRPGKAPVSMVEIQYRSKIMAQVLDVSINNAVDSLIKENKFSVLGTPKVNVIEYNDNSNLVFEVNINILPEINNIDFSAIKLNKFTINLSDEELDKSLQEVAKNYKNYTDITENRATKEGDVAVIDFIGKLNNVPFEGGQGTDYPLTLGSNTFIPGFEDQLIGKKVNDNVEVKVTFPAEYQAKELAGKDVVFDVVVKKIQAEELAEINDDLAKKAGFKTLAELKDNIKQQHTSQLDSLEQGKLKTQLLDELVKAVTITIPENILQEQEEAMWQDFLNKKEHMETHKAKGDHKDHGHTDAEAEYYNKPEAEIKADLKEQAHKTVAISLVFNSVAKENNIMLENKDVMDVVMQEAKMYGVQPEMLLSNYQKNPEFIKQLQSKAMEDKIFNFILSKVAYNETVVTFEEYLKQLSVPTA